MTTSNKFSYNKKNRTLESKEDFVSEYRSLIVDFEDAVSNLEQYQKTSMDDPTTELVEDLNRIKLHRKKLIDMLALYADADHEQWMEIRPEARSIFEAAMNAWQKSSETLSKAA